MSSSIACFVASMSPKKPTIARRYTPQISSVRCWPLSFARFESFDRAEEHYYSRKSVHFWNRFYKRHKNKFFKDRHYLEKDWGKYFCDSEANDTEATSRKVVLEVGCGTGNTIFPLVAAYPKLFVHACDFSPEAVRLVKLHSDFKDDHINVFLCDVAKNDLCHQIRPSSVDVVTLIFVMSAVSPNKMPLVLQNLKRVLKPNGHILLRDYAFGDSAQVKLQNRNQIIEDFLSSLFVRAGFNVVDVNAYCRKIDNHSKNITMWRLGHTFFETALYLTANFHIPESICFNKDLVILNISLLLYTPPSHPQAFFGHVSV